MRLLCILVGQAYIYSRCDSVTVDEVIVPQPYLFEHYDFVLVVYVSYYQLLLLCVCVLLLIHNR